MASFALRMAVVAAILLALPLAACARPVGDFGRADPDAMHDQIMPAIGARRAMAAKEPVSSFNLSDEEKDMRDRVWRYLVSPHAYDWFGATLTELQRTRIVPAGDKPLRTDLYYQWLHSADFASSHTRYSRISDDVTADIDTMPATFSSICAVLEIDHQRGVASSQINGLENSVKTDAAARRAENQATIGWFVQSVANRYASYSYALDHLLVETPHQEAERVDGLLSTLDIYVEAAQRGDFCSTSLPGGTRQDDAALRSRYLHSGTVVNGS